MRLSKALGVEIVEFKQRKTSYLSITFFVMLTPWLVHADELTHDVELPRWLERTISDIEKDGTNPFQVAKYDYEGRVVYLIDSRFPCCDLGATIYSTDGAEVCGFIGIVGAWEPSCFDFPTSGKLVEVLYGAPN
ncbi:DUF6970 domain-containing protein [Allohahella sp. A8]|uniref:DUF6970 domain-containing protein n=1 Tax=Allohahella sp. A8 TaxID=3141461 RepID=UPI003A800BB6